MRDRQVCIDCGKQSPETETNYTLISAQFGWRLTRRRSPNGDFVVEWRCAECWREHKRKLGDEPPSAVRETPADRHRPPVASPVPRTPSHAAIRAPSRPPSKPAPARNPSSRPPAPPAPSSAPGPSRPRRP